MTKIFTLISIAAILSGCGSMTKGIAPELEVILVKKGRPVGGTVVYNPFGMEQLTKMRRNKAVARMREACHPAPHQISNEQTASPEDRVEKYGGNTKVLTGSRVRFIDFKCVYPY